MTRRPSRRMRLLLMKRVERRKFRKWIAGEIRPIGLVRTASGQTVAVRDGIIEGIADA